MMQDLLVDMTHSIYIYELGYHLGEDVMTNHAHVEQVACVLRAVVCHLALLTEKAGVSVAFESPD